MVKLGRLRSGLGSKDVMLMALTTSKPAEVLTGGMADLINANPLSGAAGDGSCCNAYLRCGVQSFIVNKKALRKNSTAVNAFNGSAARLLSIVNAGF